MSLDELIRNIVEREIQQSLDYQHARVDKQNFDEIVDFKMEQIAQNIVAQCMPKP